MVIITQKVIEASRLGIDMRAGWGHRQPEFTACCPRHHAHVLSIKPGLQTATFGCGRGGFPFSISDYRLWSLSTFGSQDRFNVRIISDRPSSRCPRKVDASTIEVICRNIKRLS